MSPNWKLDPRVEVSDVPLLSLDGWLDRNGGLLRGFERGQMHLNATSAA